MHLSPAERSIVRDVVEVLERKAGECPAGPVRAFIVSCVSTFSGWLKP